MVAGFWLYVYVYFSSQMCAQPPKHWSLQFLPHTVTWDHFDNPPYTSFLTTHSLSLYGRYFETCFLALTFLHVSVAEHLPHLTLITRSLHLKLVSVAPFVLMFPLSPGWSNYLWKTGHSPVKQTSCSPPHWPRISFMGPCCRCRPLPGWWAKRPRRSG